MPPANVAPSPRSSQEQTVGLIGVPLGFGADHHGGALGTQTIRESMVRGKRLVDHISDLGYTVHDWQDLDLPHSLDGASEWPRHLTTYVKSCGPIMASIQSILQAGELPVILGGDHSIALPTLSAIASFKRAQQQDIGLIWFDAHGDLNTPETSPTGNLHGMPLAHLFGKGISPLTHLEGYAPKLNPRYCAHIGARDLDTGEKSLVRELGLNCWTMHEIDRYGMNACIEEALKVASQASGGIAVTFDVDVLDPIDAPGSGTLVRGGIFYREAHVALERIAESGHLLSFEITEVNPMLDQRNRTSELAVELILSALGKTIL